MTVGDGPLVRRVAGPRVDAVPVHPAADGLRTGAPAPGPGGRAATPPGGRPPEAPPSRRELRLTVAAVLVLQVLTVLPEVGLERNDGRPLAPLAGFLATAALLWQRTRLDAVVAVVAGLSVLSLVVFPQSVPGVVAAALVCAYLVPARWPTRRARATTALLGLLVVATVVRTVQDQGRDLAQAVVLGALSTALVVGAWALGQLRRARAQEVVAMRERVRLAEVRREQAAQIAALTERTRIAREMHDIVAHSVVGLVALADGGRYAAAHDGEAAVRALGEISRAGRETLGELRALIGTLRDPAARPTGPLPGLDDVPELVAAAAGRGLEVDLRVTGAPRPVPASTGLAAYRLVQEALTNVVKHAGITARASVDVAWGTALAVEVRDDGAGPAPTRSTTAPDGGSGLVGMRERVEALSGTLETGPLPGGGFAVRARLPLPEGAP